MRPRWPATLWLGTALILACELLLAVDASRRGVAVLPPAPGVTAAAAEGALGEAARWTAVNMTPLAWVAYLLVADGLLALRSRRRGGPPAPTRARPRRFALCFVTSVFVWQFFDWVNFNYIHAWDYYGLEPLSLVHVTIAKIVAFGAISPAMFLAAELYQRMGLARLRLRPLRLGVPWQVAAFAVGVPVFAFPFVVRAPVGCVALWVCVVLVLDPVNHWLGRGRVPTLIGDWQAGRYGRTVALAAGGLTCGLLWEFWNYWAAAKWVYALPFLGPFERYRLFEMPLAGFAGFPPFALECWVAFQTILLVLAALRLRFVEPLPDDDAVL